VNFIWWRYWLSSAVPALGQTTATDSVTPAAKNTRTFPIFPESGCIHRDRFGTHPEWTGPGAKTSRARSGVEPNSIACRDYSIRSSSPMRRRSVKQRGEICCSGRLFRTLTTSAWRNPCLIFSGTRNPDDSAAGQGHDLYHTIMTTADYAMNQQHPANDMTPTVHHRGFRWPGTTATRWSSTPLGVQGRQIKHARPYRHRRYTEKRQSVRRYKLIDTKAAKESARKGITRSGPGGFIRRYRVGIQEEVVGVDGRVRREGTRGAQSI